MGDIILKLVDYGGVGIIAVVSISLMVWLIKELQRNFDDCNERVDRLLNTHAKFMESISQDMDTVVEKMETVLRMAERLIDENDRHAESRRRQ